MQIQFTVIGKPFGKQRPRFSSRGGFAKAYTPKETVSFENYVKMCAMEVSEGKRFGDDTPIYCDIVAYYEIPKSTSKKNKEKMLANEIRPLKKPDIDNIAKSILDPCQFLMRDDSQVVEITVKKFFSDTPRTEVRFYEKEI